MLLNDKDRVYLNGIYARAYKKHFAAATNYVNYKPSVLFTWQEALEIAETELSRTNDLRREEINHSYDYRVGLISQRMERNQLLYNEQVIKINDNAAKRGMITSSVVLYQLEKAAQTHAERQTAAVNQIEELEIRRDLALAKCEASINEKTERNAKKLWNESRKLALAAQKEQGTAQSRSYKDMLALAKLKLTIPFNAQQNMDEEVYGEYLEWLLAQVPADALDYVTNEPLFALNLSPTYYAKLLNEVTGRAS